MTTDNLTHNEIKFWLSVIISAFSIAMSFSILMVRISVLENKVDTTIALLEKYDQSKNRLVDNVNDLNRRVVTLETLARK